MAECQGVVAQLTEEWHGVMLLSVYIAARPAWVLPVGAFNSFPLFACVTPATAFFLAVV